MTTLEEIASELREKGFPKHATLLASDTGFEYAKCLTKPQWYNEVREAFGSDIYFSLDFRSPEEKYLDQILPPTPFSARDYSEEPLTVVNERPFTWNSIIPTYDALRQINELTSTATELLWSDFKSQFGENEDILYRIMIDQDEQINEPTQEDLNQYKRLVKLRHNIFNSSLMYAGPSILNSQYFSLMSLMPLVCDSEGIDPTYAEFYKPDHNINIFEDIGDDDDEKIEAIINDALEYNPETLERVLESASKLLEDETLLQESFVAYWKQRSVTQRRRVINDANDSIDLYSGKYGPVGLENHEFTSIMLDPETELIIDIENTPHLLKKEPNQRDHFVWDYNLKMKFLVPQRIGMEQILAGGHVTNPLKDPLSVGQNDGQYPNIQYTQETLDHIAEIVESIKLLETELTDVGDMLVPKQVRNKKELTYQMTEMPKNPLDITFGNQSGCCIFVSDDPKKMQNGAFIPLYLSNDSVRLFQIQRVRQNTNSRIGFVMTYDTENENGDLILAVNSLELSQKGIAGGKPTLDGLTNYAEDWLIGYAREAGYHGVVMGNHSYNTSVNHSSRIGNLVQEKLKFVYDDLFYSDIFIKNKNKRLETRPNSCYWLADFRE